MKKSLTLKFYRFQWTNQAQKRQGGGKRERGRKKKCKLISKSPRKLDVTVLPAVTADYSWTESNGGFCHENGSAGSSRRTARNNSRGQSSWRFSFNVLEVLLDCLTNKIFAFYPLSDFPLPSIGSPGRPATSTPTNRVGLPRLHISHRLMLQYTPLYIHTAIWRFSNRRLSAPVAFDSVTKRELVYLFVCLFIYYKRWHAYARTRRRGSTTQKHPRGNVESVSVRGLNHEGLWRRRRIQSNVLFLDV